jgi:hypothetical protein
MNRALEVLLSPLYPGALAREHWADLQKSGLTETTVSQQKIRSVPPIMIPRLVGFDPRGIRSGYLLPHMDVAGQWLDHVYIRVFPPLTTKDGHTLKYVTPKGASPRLYFCRSTLAEVGNVEAPLWLVEGAKKACAVAQLGHAAVGYAGADCWHRKGERNVLPDLDAIPLRGRLVELLPDGDYHDNPNVHRATIRFADALRARGARPRLVRLPTELAA